MSCGCPDPRGDIHQPCLEPVVSSVEYFHQPQSGTAIRAGQHCRIKTWIKSNEQRNFVLENRRFRSHAHTNVASQFPIRLILPIVHHSNWIVSAVVQSHPRILQSAFDQFALRFQALSKAPNQNLPGLGSRNDESSDHYIGPRTNESSCRNVEQGLSDHSHTHRANQYRSIGIGHRNRVVSLRGCVHRLDRKNPFRGVGNDVSVLIPLIRYPRFIRHGNAQVQPFTFHCFSLQGQRLHSRRARRGPYFKAMQKYSRPILIARFDSYLEQSRLSSRTAHLPCCRVDCQSVRQASRRIQTRSSSRLVGEIDRVARFDLQRIGFQDDRRAPARILLNRNAEFR